MASSTSSSQSRRPPLFTAITERKQEEEDEANNPRQQQEGRHVAEAAATSAAPKKTHPGGDAAEHVVSFDKCRPSAREKTSVVPLDTACGGHGRSRSASSIASPGHNSVLRSFFSALTWRSPRPNACSSPTAAQPRAALLGEEDWRLAATELSRRLIHATRKRDEAMAEASRLKYSVAEMERKLARLDSYCHDLKSAPDRCNHCLNHHGLSAVAASGDFPVETFLRAISDARTAVRRLGRALAAQMRRGGEPRKAHARLSQLRQQQDAHIPSSGGGSGLLFQLEALLSRAFYEDFELSEFQRKGCDRVLDPRARAAANMAAYASLRGLCWDDVLGRGTRHYSEGFSRFCDCKMGEVAKSALGGGWWDGAWPEPMLRAFFDAAKEVWLVHLLAWCGHPPVPIFRVEKGAPFDAGFMEDVAAGENAGRPESGVVRVMLAPGFYVQGVVVKCRVLCGHGSRSKSSSNVDKNGSTKIRVSSDGLTHSEESSIRIRRQQKG